MKLAGIAFLVAVSAYFLLIRLIRKKKKGDIETEKTEPKNKEPDESNDGKPVKKFWNKKSTYFWFFIIQFVFFNFIYPGRWFEVKTLYWFFATMNSDKYVAVKKINTILEKDNSKKLSSIQAEIKEMEGKTELTEDDKKKLGELTKEVLSVGKPPTHAPRRVARAREEPLAITKNVSGDLLSSAYLSWKKPKGYSGTTCKKQVVAMVKITRLNDDGLSFSNKEKGFTANLAWKSAGFYQGDWHQGLKGGLIKLTPGKKGEEIVSFCGAVGEGTTSPNVPCWVTATMP
ncbi:MAG: hypothetical protein UT63_C0101G0007 [Candidatus Gottesmanbacteria bacterium GW2011_GWC2_39_8]|uniref:Uncharacterized protein n=1 Tax=Candidatus Gottesmanbacteria bacterium GW2011_GWC2_39_8 TaxID=1618450 RepID=A0A0G0PZ07_9BACT|nr:MAG: hypothetical protein UT63_C0101G0007 [Candidatus Gottesmanbacteria bacterium GW2011_GWC2_39_8]